MNRNKQYYATIDMLLTLTEQYKREIRFDNAIAISMGPFTPPFNIWGVKQVLVEGWKSGRYLYVMDAEENWHQVEYHDTSIINSLWQRLNVLMIHQLKTA